MNYKLEIKENANQINMIKYMELYFYEKLLKDKIKICKQIDKTNFDNVKSVQRRSSLIGELGSINQQINILMNNSVGEIKKLIEDVLYWKLHFEKYYEQLEAMNRLGTTEYIATSLSALGGASGSKAPKYVYFEKVTDEL